MKMIRSAALALVMGLGFTSMVAAQTKMGDTSKMAKAKMEKSKMSKMDKMDKMSHGKMSKMHSDKMSHGKMKKDTSKM